MEDILRSLGLEVRTSGHHHCRPGWLQIDCPFCGQDSGRFHLGFNISRGYFNCWRCGPHPVRAVLERLGVPASQSRKLQEEAKQRDPDAVVPTPKTYAAQLDEPKHRGPLLEAHCRYLRSRGLDPEALQQIWSLEGIGVASRLSWRIYIPITHQGKRVSWTTRSIAPDAEQRYISASASQETVPHKSLVYGADHCRHGIVIVEGPADAWAIGPGAGALFGTAFSIPQVRQLIRFLYRTVCFDSSPDAQARARELASQLSVFPGVTQVVQLDAKDPGSAGSRELSRLRRAARL